MEMRYTVDRSDVTLRCEHVSGAIRCERIAGDGSIAIRSIRRGRIGSDSGIEMSLSGVTYAVATAEQAIATRARRAQLKQVARYIITHCEL